MGRIANRKDELALFDQMLRGVRPHRILLLEGPSERGKSFLLAELTLLAEELLGRRCYASASFKGGLSLAEFFARVCSDLGEEIFASYTRIPPHVFGQANVNVNMADAKFGDHNRVSVQANIPPCSQVSVQRLGEAILKDLRSWSKPLALFVDTFEAATDEASRWTIQQFLPALCRNQHLCVVLAGQRVPSPGDFEPTWGRLAIRRLLEPVTSVDDWHEFACSRHPAFPRGEIETLCQGKLWNYPSVMRDFIETRVLQLPPRNARGGVLA